MVTNPSSRLVGFSVVGFVRGASEKVSFAYAQINRSQSLVNERAKRATNERLNWATWENK
jgi:hypothetical protein